jgi:hypothetical protein
MSEEVVVSTKDRPGTFDALETAKPGEPIFTLQGGDPFTPPTILYWCELARADALKIRKKADREARLRKISVAEQIAWAMQEYQRGEVDHTEAARATYNDSDQLPDSDATTFLARAADRLYNAAGEASRMADQRAARGMPPRAVSAIRKAIVVLNGATACIEPRRHLQRMPTGG